MNRLSPWARSAPAGTAAILAGSVGAALAVTASSRGQALIAGIAFTVACLTIASWRGLRHNRRDLFSPPVLLSAYLALGIGIKGVSDLLSGTSKIEGLFDPTGTQFADLMTVVFLQTGLAIAAFLVGDALAGRRSGPPGSWRTPAPLLPASGVQAALALSLCMTGLGVAVLVAKLGMAILLDPSFVSTSGTVGLFWLYPLMYASIGGWALVIVNRWSAGRNAGALPLLGLVVTAAVVYLLTSSKAAIVIAVLYLMVGHHYAVRPARVWQLLGAAGGFVVLLPLLYLHRAVGFSQAFLKNVTLENAASGLNILVGRSYLADSFAAVLHHTPRIYPFRLGATWLELFYFWIPRGIWPAKPLSLSLSFGPTYLSSYRQSGGAFYSPTLMGDAYLNFGIIGVVLVFLGAGYGMRRLYDHLIGRAPRPEGVVLYGLLVYWIAIGAEQSAAVITELALSYMAPVALLAFVARNWKRVTLAASRINASGPSRGRESGGTASG